MIGAARYFAPRMFAPRFWPKLGAEIIAGAVAAVFYLNKNRYYRMKRAGLR